MQVMRQLLHIGTPGSRHSQRTAFRGRCSCLPRKAWKQSPADRGRFAGFYFLRESEGHFLLWCDAVQIGRNLLKFRDNTLLPSSTLTLKTEAVGSSSMLIHLPDNTASHIKWQVSLMVFPLTKLWEKSCIIILRSFILKFMRRHWIY